jgi:hypothetical protein
MYEAGLMESASAFKICHAISRTVDDSMPPFQASCNMSVSKCSRTNDGGSVTSSRSWRMHA